MKRLALGLGFLCGAFVSAVYNDPWDRVLVTGFLTAVVFFAAVVARDVWQALRTRRADTREVKRLNTIWKQES